MIRVRITFTDREGAVEYTASAALVGEMYPAWAEVLCADNFAELRLADERHEVLFTKVEDAPQVEDNSTPPGDTHATAVELSLEAMLRKVTAALSHAVFLAEKLPGPVTDVRRFLIDGDGVNLPGGNGSMRLVEEADKVLARYREHRKAGRGWYTQTLAPLLERLAGYLDGTACSAPECPVRAECRARKPDSVELCVRDVDWARDIAKALKR